MSAAFCSSSTSPSLSRHPTAPAISSTCTTQQGVHVHTVPHTPSQSRCRCTPLTSPSHLRTHRSFLLDAHATNKHQTLAPASTQQHPTVAGLTCRLFLAPGMGTAPLQMIQFNATCSRRPSQGTAHTGHRCTQFSTATQAGTQHTHTHAQPSKETHTETCTHTHTHRPVLVTCRAPPRPL